MRLGGVPDWAGVPLRADKNIFRDAEPGRCSDRVQVQGNKRELNIRVHSLFPGLGKKPISSVVGSKEIVMEKYFEYQHMIKILFLL